MIALHACIFLGLHTSSAGSTSYVSPYLSTLMLQVAKSLTSNIRAGLSSDSDSSLIDYMHDPQRVALYKQLQETAENLKKAHMTLRKL